MKIGNSSLFLRFFLASAFTMFVVWIGVLVWETWVVQARFDQVQTAETKGWTRQILASVSSPGLSDGDIRNTIRRIEAARGRMYADNGFFQPRWRLQVWRGATLLHDEGGVTAPSGANGKANERWAAWNESDPESRIRVQLAQELVVAWTFGLASASHQFAPLLYCFPFLLMSAWLTIRYGLRPLHEAVRQINSRTAADLSPLPVPSHRELAPLIESTNQLMARLSERLYREQEFLVDAAHQLKTPLATVQSNAELLVAARDPIVADAARGGLCAGVADAAHVVHQLLALARSDAPEASEPLASLDLAELVRSRLAIAAGTAMPRNVDVDFDGPEHCMAHLAHTSTSALIDNLVSNAIKYSPDGGRVCVRLARSAGTIELTISDEGPGIPEDMREKVFERFVRVPGQDQAGSGLGLAIAERAAARNRARVSLHGREPGAGVIAQVSFLHPAKQRQLTV